MMDEDENPFASVNTYNESGHSSASVKPVGNDFHNDDGSMVFMDGDVGVPVSGSISGYQDDEAAQRNARVEERKKQHLGCCYFLRVEYYQPYFDIETTDVIDRLVCVAQPWKADFFDVLKSRPDFYGPFWICATLVFLIAAMSNLESYWDYPSDATEPWHHNFEILSFALILVFGFALAMPVVAWGVFTYLGVSTSNISFAELACVYGYSIAAFLPACVLCSIPSSIVEWISVIVFLVVSTLFLQRNLWARLGVQDGGYIPPIAGADGSMELSDEVGVGQATAARKTAAIFLFGLCGLHVVFALILKLYFFQTHG